jgi:hypothetical protein
MKKSTATITAKVRQRTPESASSKFVLDLTGLTFGELIVIGRVMAAGGKGYANARQIGKKGRSSLWLCKCSCGAVTMRSRDYLRNSSHASCGHISRGRPTRELTGAVFGELTVIRHVDYSDDGYKVWLCKCSCGNQALVKGVNLLNGNTRSCGHLRKDNARKQSDNLRAIAKKQAERQAEKQAENGGGVS